ncbi:MAG: putative DNA modification/repair radical SAM protein [Bacteroidetes bacterium]|nr:putative DNA modification/repair radical SAM protein [Bacteroidota bacterium]
MWDRIKEKLGILADSAKYDVSCASSGSKRKNENKGLGNASNGICHAYTEDGRCVSLLKILLTNHCIYDCAYCVSRRSNDVKRAAFTVQEVVDLTINFYRRNYIEGLFLSSGIFKNADYTMERLVLVAKKLRTEHNFNGYIHLKLVPGASKELVEQAGQFADRLSVNIEIPTEEGLRLLAPDKKREDMLHPMRVLKNAIDESADRGPRPSSLALPAAASPAKSRLFAPAGQSTQMVIGATAEPDLTILKIADAFYKKMKLRRVYYSGYVPISTDNRLPAIGTPVPLIRENRLYQADWLIRWYGFSVDELLSANQPSLDMEIDPKLAWALQNLHVFPLDINTADLLLLKRIPGIGLQSAERIVQARRYSPLHWDQLKKMGVAINRARYFIICKGLPQQPKDYAAEQIRQFILSAGHSKYHPNFSPQLALFQ